MATIDDSNFILDCEIISVFQKFIGLDTNKLFKSLLLEKIEILKYYLKYPNNATSEYYKYIKDKSITPQRTIYRYTEELAKEGFLELVIENQKLIKGTESKYKKPYRLSLIAIFYIILNATGISHIDLIKGILKNYKETLLFNLFLYPIIKEKTIDKIDYDISFFSIIVEYLNNVCKDILVTIKWLKNMDEKTSDDGYLMNRVFIWYNNPTDNSKSDLIDKIRFFLETILKWNDVDLLIIEPKIDDSVIEIIDTYNPTRNSKITILKNKKKAVLRQNGGKIIHEFSIISNDTFLSIETKSNIKSIDEIKFPFLERCEEHLIDFLTKLRTKLLHSSSLFTNPTFEILSEDERYNKALEHLDKELNLK